MKKTNKLFESLLFLVLTTVLLVVSTLAWFVSFNTPSADDVIVSIGNFDVDITLEVRRGTEGEYFVVENGTDLALLFDNAVPNDLFQFRLTIVNQGSSSLLATTRLTNISHYNVPIEYDVRNVICLDEGKVYINGILNVIQPNSLEPVEMFDQVLLDYRINNFIDNSNSITLANDILLSINGTQVIEFTLFYDYNTSAKGYQSGQLLIEAFSIYFNFA